MGIPIRHGQVALTSCCTKAGSYANLNRRLTVPAADDQMRRLATTWNDLLARIESATAQITQFTADASHELRNPLACIRTYAEYSLGNAHMDAESRQAFRVIADEAALTGELLENLLILAHPEAQLSPAELQAVDVSAAISEAVRPFHVAAGRKNQRLSATSPGAPTALWINPLHLRRVLTIVLDNAVKYTPEEGRISVRCESAHGFVLSIADNGIGIAHGHLARVFDRSYRVDPARCDVSEGVGFGLPITKWLTERYGGTIAIKSELGRGTAVTVAFPGCMVLAEQALTGWARW